MNEVMTLQQVAETLGLSLDTIQRYVREGRIRGSAVSGVKRKKYVVTRANLQDYLDKSMVQVESFSEPSKPRITRTPCPILSKYGY